MVADADFIYDVIGFGEEDGEFGEFAEGFVEREGEQYGEDECHDLILRDGGSKQPDSHKCTCKQEQSNVRTRHTASVNIASRVAERAVGVVINQRRQYRNDHEEQASQVFAHNDGEIAEGTSDEEFDSTCLAFFGEGAHRNRRNEYHQYVRRSTEKAIHRSVAVVQDIALREDPHDHTRQHQKHANSNVTNERTEK